jgi:hypothetical protein
VTDLHRHAQQRALGGRVGLRCAALSELDPKTLRKQHQGLDLSSARDTAKLGRCLFRMATGFGGKTSPNRSKQLDQRHGATPE